MCTYIHTFKDGNFAQSYIDSEIPIYVCQCPCFRQCKAISSPFLQGLTLEQDTKGMQQLTIGFVL